MPKLMKTTGQIKAIFALGHKVGCGHEELRELAFDVTKERTDSLKALTFDEANGMIRRLGGRAFDKPNQGFSRRTIQRRKQIAGVETIVSQAQLAKLQKLADGRGMSNEGLKSMSLRMIKKEKPTTTKECGKLIEAIKAMNTRDRTFTGFNKNKEAA